MSSREIVLWIDERWYDALNRHLKDESVEDKLEDYLDQLVNQLPAREYEKISKAIWQEAQERSQAAEAAKRFAIFHVTENNQSEYFVAEENLEMLQVASRLRSYMRKDENTPATQFKDLFSRRESISREQFDTYAAERVQNTGRVTGAFHIDLDADRFEALNIMDGWHCFRTQDVSTAAYFAMKKAHAETIDRWNVFLERLGGKEITPDAEYKFLTGTRALRPEDVSFSDEVIQNENLLEF